jgi:hypothetical protein
MSAGESVPTLRCRNPHCTEFDRYKFKRAARVDHPNRRTQPGLPPAPSKAVRRVLRPET